MKYFLLITVTLALGLIEARGCDLCGCYTPQLETMPQATAANPFGLSVAHPVQSWRDRLYLAVSEQFTYFNTVQVDGREVPNPTDQYLASSITQLVAGYGLTSRFALQVNVPLIYRSFQRPEGFAIDRGTESGIGDVSLLLKSVVFHYASPGRREVRFEDGGKSPVMISHEPDLTASLVLLTGVKFPTGDSSRLKEEFNEIEIPGAPESGIHGHDLTLGTGSYDGIFGAQFSLRHRNLFLQSDLQFTLRGDGRHQYHFANDLAWSGGPGIYLMRKPNAIIGAQFLLSGEYKDVDRFRGKAADDTGITSIFAGPRLVVSLGKISAEITAQFPLKIDNTALQVVPDYRLNGAIAIRF